MQADMVAAKRKVWVMRGERARAQGSAARVHRLGYIGASAQRDHKRRGGGWWRNGRKRREAAQRGASTGVLTRRRHRDSRLGGTYGPRRFIMAGEGKEETGRGITD